MLFIPVFTTLPAFVFSLGTILLLASFSLKFSSFWLSSSAFDFSFSPSSLSSGDFVSLSIVTVFGGCFSSVFSVELVLGWLPVFSDWLSVWFSFVSVLLNAFSVNGYSHESGPRSDV